MKKQLTIREKVLMCILAVLMVICAYNLLFYNPTIQELAYLAEESDVLDEQITTVDIQVAKMNQMKAELEAIASGELGDDKEIPAYDNSANVMNSLSAILKNAKQYNVTFSSIEQEDSTVRRNIRLSYSTKDYKTAKKILTQIYEGEYRCLLKDVHLSSSDEAYNVTVDITYFEYKK